MGENREQAFAIELLNVRFTFQDHALQRLETCTFAGQEEREALQRNTFLNCGRPVVGSGGLGPP
jgi:hypothetical protein